MVTIAKLNEKSNRGGEKKKAKRRETLQKTIIRLALP